METYIGLDFGGTKLLIGELDAAGRVLQSKRYSTGVRTQAQAVAVIEQALADFLATTGFVGTPVAAGLGIVGQADHERGEWIALSADIEGPPVKLAALLQSRLGVPAYIDNDVRSATTAELMLGVGRRSKNFIYLNVGTGLAAGFVVNGHILRGANNNSGEIGHTVVDMYNDTPCECDRHGCVESIVSGRGFTRQMKREGLELLTQVGDKKRADVPGLFADADAGDAASLRITEYAADTLAALIMNLVRVTDPDTVVLGGGVVSDGWLLQRVLPRLGEHTMRGVHGGVVLSAFDAHHVGLIGAASLGMRRHPAKARLAKEA